MPNTMDLTPDPASGVARRAGRWACLAGIGALLVSLTGCVVAPPAPSPGAKPPARPVAAPLPAHDAVRSPLVASARVAPGPKLKAPQFAPARRAPIPKRRARPANCGGKQVFFAARNGGECWTCPNSYGINKALPITHPKVCAKRNKLGVPKIVRGPFQRARYAYKANGCPAGEFRKGNQCMVCPPGYKRSHIAGIDGNCKRNQSDFALLRDYAESIGHALQPQLQALNAIRGCMMTRGIHDVLLKALGQRDLRTATRLRDRCVTPAQIATLRGTPRGAQSNDHQPVTLTVAASAGGMGGVGLGGGLAVTWDLTGGRQARFSTTGEGAWGAGGAVGGDLSVGFGIDNLPASPGVEQGTSVVFSGKFVGGASVAIDFSRSHSMAQVLLQPGDVAGKLDQLFDDFEGASVGGGVGIGAEVGTLHTSRTRFW